MTVLCLECAIASGVNALWMKLQEPEDDLCELCGDQKECIKYPGGLAGFVDDIVEQEEILDEMSTGNG